MHPTTFVADFSGYMALLAGIMTIAMATIWVICGKVMPSVARQDIAKAKTPERKAYLERGLAQFQDFAKKARTWTIMAGIILALLLWIYFKYGH